METNLLRKKESIIKKDKVLSNQIIAVWGSPGSGKTTLSYKMGAYLAREKYSVIIVHDDSACPVIHTMITIPGELKQNKSLGIVLSQNIRQAIIKDNLVTFKGSDYIALLGYDIGENYKSYPPYDSDLVSDLLVHLRHLADFIIVDCSSYLKDNAFTDTVLQKADKVIALSTADLKGLSYFNSTLPLLDCNIKDRLSIVTKIKNSDMSEQIAEVVNDLLNGKDIFLPYTDEIEEQAFNKRLFDTLLKDESKSYNEGVQKIMEEILYS